MRDWRRSAVCIAKLSAARTGYNYEGSEEGMRDWRRGRPAPPWPVRPRPSGCNYEEMEETAGSHTASEPRVGRARAQL